MRRVSDLGFHVSEISALIWLCPSCPGPQELTDTQAVLRVQAAELCQAHNRQEEFLKRLWEAQERETAAASQIKALSSQLEEVWVIQREVSDGRREGRVQGTESPMFLHTHLWQVRWVPEATRVCCYMRLGVYVRMTQRELDGEG